MKLLLDTNFIVDLCKFRIDLSEVYDLISESAELYIFNKTLDELKVLSMKAKHGKYAKLALHLIDSTKIHVLKTDRDVDNSILTLDNTFIVATNDKKLRQKLRQKEMKTIYLRSRKHLAIG